MKFFNTSLLMASTMSELADVHYTRTSTRYTMGFGHEPCTFMSRLLWPSGPRYSTTCQMCNMAYCVCAGREPSPIAPMSWLCGCQICSRLVYLEHTRTPASEPYTPTLSPAYSYSSAFANLEAMSDCSNDTHDGTQHGSGHDSGSGDDNEDGSGGDITLLYRAMRPNIDDLVRSDIPDLD